MAGWRGDVLAVQEMGPRHRRAHHPIPHCLGQVSSGWSGICEPFADARTALPSNSTCDSASPAHLGISPDSQADALSCFSRIWELSQMRRFDAGLRFRARSAENRGASATIVNDYQMRAVAPPASALISSFVYPRVASAAANRGDGGRRPAAARGVAPRFGYLRVALSLAARAGVREPVPFFIRRGS